jgi:hypothetical protein
MNAGMESRSKENMVEAVDGQIIVSDDIETRVATRPEAKRRAYLVHIYIPLIFLTATLLGGLRFSSGDGSFIFLKPSLVCLIFAAMLMVLFARAGLVRFGGWFSENASLLANAASAAVIGSVYAASTQIFNSLIPEQGLPYWVVTFCFFWTLCLVLLNLASPADQGWLESILKNPSQSAATWLLDIPRFSAATGYIQFFAVALYLLGLYLLPSSRERSS